MTELPQCVVAGASGFVGSRLVEALARDYRVIALSRGNRPPSENITWRACDLFSLLQTEAAVKGCDYAVYLVHSMLPAKLTQASFEDMDLILADNFVRSCAAAGVKQIIYLGGLIPEEGKLSKHLASRLEVEEVLASRGIPVTSLRAGLILGGGGSSFRIMLIQSLRHDMVANPDRELPGFAAGAEPFAKAIVQACLRVRFLIHAETRGPEGLRSVDDTLAAVAHLFGLTRSHEATKGITDFLS